MNSRISQTIAQLSLVAAGFAWPLEGDNAAAKNDETWTFETIELGKTPGGWLVEATNRDGSLATWEVIKDGEGKILALTKTNHNSSASFNLIWTPKARFLDGEMEVKLKSVSGKEDQGGGIIWRVKDKDNYYVARFNPLESNFRIYFVRNGERTILASERFTAAAGQWLTLKISHKADQIAGYIDGKKLLEVRDQTFPNTGGIGLWTKADANTVFDDLKIKSLQ